ncbi:MAG: hypothetical protein JWO96_509 [Candidatus Saccharibacteria bacterium]|nr:hypothetical protein [Candidatus Saccharibacteria bacterium]
MQPQEPIKPSYDFILKDQQKSASRPLSNLPMPVLVVAAVVILMILLIIFGSLLGSKKAKTTGLTDVLGRAQEITRVNTLQQGALKDPTNLGLEATSQSGLTSDQTQLKKYMSSHKIKVDAKKLASYQNKNTDTQLAGAAQNNNLDTAYLTYLRQALADYAGALKTAYAGTNDSGAKVILQDSYNSTQTLLSSPALKG